MRIKELAAQAAQILEEKEDSGFDIMCLLEDIGGITPEKAAVYPDEEITDSTAARVLEAAQKRSTGYPLQYILGQWEFYGRPFKVGDGVLIPRPDTEALIDEAVTRLKKSGKTKPVIIDLCSGSGCIAVTLAKELDTLAYAVELSSEALPYLSENIRRNKADVKIIKGDVMNGAILENFRDTDEDADGYIPIDCIVSNPPYLTDKEMSELQTEVRHEPEMALSGGIDGLKFYRVITLLWKELLCEDGLLIYEIGTEQEQAVKEILTQNGFTDIFTANDGTRAVRVIGGRKHS